MAEGDRDAAAQGGAAGPGRAGAAGPDRAAAGGGGRRRAGAALLGAGLVLAALQFVPVERTNPPVVSEHRSVPAVDSLLRSACYDCHSNETRWPWYARVAPASLLLGRHVREGRGALNFSEWPAWDLEEQELLGRLIVEQLEDDAMPPRTYRLLHPEARLEPAERARIADWFRPAEVLDPLGLPGG
ncbi:MAG: heme-binding protein [Gemmatimonadetes bacterium]|nr:MAG: heme-binding protein [Gemmatimonadota bacterium]